MAIRPWAGPAGYSTTYSTRYTVHGTQRYAVPGAVPDVIVQYTYWTVLYSDYITISVLLAFGTFFLFTIIAIIAIGVVLPVAVPGVDLYRYEYRRDTGTVQVL